MKKQHQFYRYLLLCGLTLQGTAFKAPIHMRAIASVENETRPHETIEKMQPRPIQLIPNEIKAPELAKPQKMVETALPSENIESIDSEAKDESEDDSYQKLKQDYDTYVCDSQEKMNQLNKQIELLVQQQQVYLSLFMMMTQLMFNHMQIQNQTVTYTPYQFGSYNYSQPYIYPLGEAPLVQNQAPQAQSQDQVSTGGLIAPQGAIAPTVSHNNEMIESFQPQSSLGFYGFNFDNSYRSGIETLPTLPLQILN